MSAFKILGVIAAVFLSLFGLILLPSVMILTPGWPFGAAAVVLLAFSTFWMLRAVRRLP